MGYHTDFEGNINIDKPLDDKLKNILNGLNKTRRMKRDVNILAKNLNISVKECKKLYGEYGEFYFNHDSNFGQTHTDDIINYNQPPSGQPNLWCGWLYNEEENTIEWDGSEKFYDYIEWITYIRDLLSKEGYTLNGGVDWFGEERDDKGTITLKNNKILIK